MFPALGVPCKWQRRGGTSCCLILRSPTFSLRGLRPLRPPSSEVSEGERLQHFMEQAVEEGGDEQQLLLRNIQANEHAIRYVTSVDWTTGWNAPLTSQTAGAATEAANGHGFLWERSFSNVHPVLSASSPQPGISSSRDRSGTALQGITGRGL